MSLPSSARAGSPAKELHQMSMDNTSNTAPIGVGVVGIQPGRGQSILEEMPCDGTFEFVAFSDEGCEETGPENRPVPYYQDYHMMLDDPRVELVLVDGPVEMRRDLSVRALNAGRHVVLQEPFCEDGHGAERVARTALKKGLVATCDLGSRDEPSFRALLEALQGEDCGPVYGLHRNWFCPEQDREGLTGLSLLEQMGTRLLDQVRTLLEGEIKSVTTCLYPREDGLEREFLLYLSLRSGGWGTLRASLVPAAHVPRWIAFTPSASLTGDDEGVVVEGENGTKTCTPTGEPEDFWRNVHAAIRSGATLKYHPVQIVRAVKLWEAALSSAEDGGPAVI